MSSPSNTAEEILTCARSLIIAGGYGSFSYADIAKVVGISKPSIHHHFPTKADLVREVVARYRHDAAAGLAGLERQVPDHVAQLEAYLGYWARCIADGSASFCVCALLAAEQPALPPEVAAEVKAHFRSLSDWLAALLERGSGTGRITLVSLPATEAEVIMATVHGAMLAARAYGDPKVFTTITGPLLTRLTIPR